MKKGAHRTVAKGRPSMKVLDRISIDRSIDTARHLQAADKSDTLIIEINCFFFSNSLLFHSV